MSDLNGKTTESVLINEVMTNIGQKTVEDSLESFKKLSEPSAIYDDSEVYNSFFSIKYIIKNQSFKDFSIFVKHECGELFENLLRHFYTNLNEIDLDSCKVEIAVNKNELSDDRDQLNQRRFSIFYNLLVIINEAVFRSIEVNLYLGSIEIVRLLVGFLNESFVRKCAKKKAVILLLIKNLSLLSRWNDECKTEWKELNLVEAILNTNKILGEEEKVGAEKELNEIMLHSYYSIGNIANDKQIEALPEIPTVVDMLLNEMVSIADHFAKEKSIEKIKAPFMNSDKKVELLKVSNPHGRSLIPNLIGLTRFAVNETTKKAIFAKFKAMRIIIFKARCN